MSISLESDRTVPTVKLELESRPESLTLVRSMLVGVADLLGFDAELLHNLKTVVSEACNNVVLHAYDGETGPLTVALEITPAGVEATVRDWGCGIRQVTPADDGIHVGLAVISAIADRAQFVSEPGGGTEVRMGLSDRSAVATFGSPPDGGRGERLDVGLSGDAVATLEPVGLLSGVLARVATALAARARFSLDRFCDVYLVTDWIAAHAQASAIGDRLSFAIAARKRRLELTVGPFRTGSGVAILGDQVSGRPGSALSLLAVDFAVEPVVEAEMWRLVVFDGDGAVLGAR